MANRCNNKYTQFENDRATDLFNNIKYKNDEYDKKYATTSEYCKSPITCGPTEYLCINQNNACKYKELTAKFLYSKQNNLGSDEKYSNTKTIYNIEYMKRINYIIGIVGIFSAVYYIKRRG